MARSRSDSRERILDAAERLFAEKGIGSTSLRDIGAAASANTGSIYFHFKTKAALLREVFRRRLEPLDAERLAALDRCEADAAPGAPPLEDVLEALIAPLLRLARGEKGGAHFMRVLGRTYGEPDAEVVRMLRRDHGHTMDRFRTALARALPHLPEEELFLRFHFALGSVAYTMGSDVSWRLVSGRRPPTGSWDEVLGQLMPFLVAGLEAPAAARGARRQGAA